MQFIYLLPVIFFIYGALYVLFAFKEPPESLRSWFRVIFFSAVIPGRKGIIVGRFITGIGMMTFAYWFYYSLQWYIN